jgi:putative membrane protein
VRRGVFRHYIWMIPVEKFHVFYTTASIFQRRLGLKSLFVDTAGAAAFAYPEVVDVRAEPADRGLADLYDQFRTLYDQRLRAATADPSSSRERLSIPEEELRNL